MDGRIMYDTLKIVDKSMNDYVNSYNNDKYTGDKQIKQEALESLRYKLK